ncbi:MAG: tRNA lysidine(34) synthetase TilS [Gammaproteobacteria bacterium]|nr:tRNA lysidine(34) synthetase TilS [Gammaproteobacteria bacterium]
MGTPHADVSRTVALISGTGDIAVGYSGGLDSTVLLHAAAMRFAAPRLRALHVNHGLQAESLDWQRHCERVAAGLGVPIEVVRVTVGSGNVESQARRARYAAWKETLRPSEILLLAHHANDQAETVLWRLLTGRAPVGMPAERPLGAGCVVRPFLHLRRSRLVAYAKKHDLAWVEDPSNADRTRDRNFIRHEIMPNLETRFPRAVEVLAAVAPDTLPVPASSLPIDGLTPIGLRAWLRAGVPDRRIGEILRQAHAGADANPVIRLPGGDTVRRYGERLYRVPSLSMREVRASEGSRVEVGVPGKLPHGTIGWRRGSTGLRGGEVLTVRYRRGAERFAPVGRGVTKRLKTLFQEHRIPPWQRNAWPLLFDGDFLAAIPGIGVAKESAVQRGWWPDWTPF